MPSGHYILSINQNERCLTYGATCPHGVCWCCPFPDDCHLGMKELSKCARQEVISDGKLFDLLDAI